MPKIYNVLWIDDQPENISQLPNQAADHDIRLTNFTSVEAGFEELKKDLYRYDAILLDARSFEKKGQVPGTEHERALDQARDEIMRLHDQKVFPYFVFTGQESLQNDKSFNERYAGRYFKKNSIEETERLFDAIKKEVDAQPETQLRARYAPAFAACTDTTLGETAGRLLVKVLQAVEKPQSNHGDDDTFNTLRQLVEAFFQALHSHKLLPDQCQETGKFNLTYSRLFLMGEQVRPHNGTPSFKARQVLLPAVLADALHRLIELTNNGSHFQHDAQITPGQRQATEAKLTQLRQRVKTPYLLASLTYQVLDLLVWLKVLLDSADLATYQRTWDVNSPSVAAGSPVAIAGKIMRIAAGGSASFIADADNAQAHIPKRLVDAHHLTVGQAVRILLDARPPDPGNRPIVAQIFV